MRTGVKYEKPEDLRGKKIGIAGFRSAMDILLKRWMKLKGVDPRDMTFIEAQFPQMPDLLRNGTLDAVTATEPIRSIIVKSGVGFIADIHNRKSHGIVEQGLQILLNLDHRGAVGADPKLGDGCGILVQIPHRFFQEECGKLGITLPEARKYGIAQFFMPRNAAARADVKAAIEKAIDEEGLKQIGRAHV